MANKYPVTGGSGNWTDDSNWTLNSDGSPNITVAPTAADDVFFNATTPSPQAINANAVARSLDCTGFTGTLTHASGVNCTLGDGTAGAGSIALKFVSGMTWTPSGTSSAFVFVSTASATNQSIDFAGKTMRNIFFSAQGQWYLASGITQSAAATLTHTAGIVHYDGASDNSALTHTLGLWVNNGTTTRTTTLGTTTLNIIGTGTVVNIVATNNTRSFASSTINMTGANPRMIAGSSSSFGTVTFDATGIADIDTGTFATLTMTNTGGDATAVLQVRGNITVTTALTLTGISAANRPYIRSLTLGTAVTITCTGATISTPNCDFRDITFARTTAGDLDLTAGGTVLVGDAGGNTRTGGTGVVTFTTPATQTWQTVAGGSWGTAANWTSRVPLPQDDVTFAGVSFNSGVSVTTGVTAARLGKNINIAGYTYSGTKPTFSFASTTHFVFGSLTLASSSDMTLTHSQPITFEGRSGSFTLTTGGNTIGDDFIFQAIGGTYTLQDALTHSSTGDISVLAGTFNTNDFSTTSRNFISTGTITRVLNFGSSTITWTQASGLGWNFVSTGMTLNAGTSLIVQSSNSASAKSFSGGGLVYNDLRLAGGAAGALTISGANTFNRLYTDGGGTLSVILTGSTTTTIVSGLGLNNGTNVITFTATTGSATVSKSGGGTVSWDYVNLTNIPAAQASTWYAGTNSTDGGGNTNWIFTDPPAAGNAGYFFRMF